jgi:hypothetical protein
MNTLTQPVPPVTTVKKPILEAVMAYQFDPLIHRMMDQRGWKEEKVMSVFEDLKRFLFLCAVSETPIVPTRVIDEMWHDFILFTEDYAMFCQSFLGKFIHHRPRRRDEPRSHDKSIKTLAIAKAAFGELSANWEYRKADGTLVDFSAAADCNSSGNCIG